MSIYMESNGYSLQITGAKGRERYTLRDMRDGNAVVGSGDLRKAVATHSRRGDRVKTAARERLTRFERKNALVSAEARLRKFRLDSKLAGM